MSAEDNFFDKNDKAELRRTAFLTPSGNLHASAGYIEKQEQYLLTNIEVMGEFIKAANKRIRELSNNDHLKKDYEGQTMDDIISDTFIATAQTFNSYSGSLKGFRSKQLKGISSSPRITNNPQDLEPKRSIWDKIRGKNKSDDSP